MSFTYTGGVDSDLEKVRHAIGDTTLNAGVKPDGSNFSDQELSLHIGPITDMGLTWRSAVPVILRILANLYAVSARSEKFADYAVDFTQTATQIRAQAAEWEVSITAAGAVRTGGISTGVLTYTGLYTSYTAAGVLAE